MGSIRVNPASYNIRENYYIRAQISVRRFHVLNTKRTFKLRESRRGNAMWRLKLMLENCVYLGTRRKVIGLFFVTLIYRLRGGIMTACSNFYWRPIKCFWNLLGGGIIYNYHLNITFGHPKNYDLEGSYNNNFSY